MAPKDRRNVPTMQGKMPPWVMDSRGASVRNSQLMAGSP